MKKLLVAIMVLGLFSCNDDSKKATTSDKDGYEKAKENLGDKEKKNPADFISVEGSDKHNLIGQTVVKGTITNKATVVKYKDVEIQLDFYSKTQTLLETDKEVVFEIIAPGESKKFKTKYFAPKGTDSVALKVITAKVSE